METVLSNFHGQSARIRNLLRRILRSQNDRTDWFSITYKKCEGGRY